jgi:hypothetical protein
MNFRIQSVNGHCRSHLKQECTGEENMHIPKLLALCKKVHNSTCSRAKLSVSSYDSASISQNGFDYVFVGVLH